MPATHLIGPSAFPAGLFAGDRHAELSAVISSNACPIAKLNRVATSGQGASKHLRYMRIGNFFDRPICLPASRACFGDLAHRRTDTPIPQRLFVIQILGL